MVLSFEEGPTEPASLQHLSDAQLHGNQAHICHHGSHHPLTKAGVSGEEEEEWPGFPPATLLG